MTLLSVISSVCLRSGITDAPTFVIGNTDATIGQLLELLREEVETLAGRYPWARLQKEATFNTLAADYQAELYTVAPDFERFIDETQWNRAFSQPLAVPITPATWQELKARLATSVYYGMRIKQNPATLGLGIYLIPTPPAGNAVYFEYISRYYYAAGAVAKSDCTLDTDTFLLPEHLIKAGLRWRWKKEKGLTYAEDFNTYERLVEVSYANDGGGMPTLSMSPEANGLHLIDNTNVPDGNWS